MSRPHGGTRYSASAHKGQCDGTADVDYPGSGSNRHCAFNDVRYFWTDASSYCTDNAATSACWKWIGKGGDTYLNPRAQSPGGVVLQDRPERT